VRLFIIMIWFPSAWGSFGDGYMSASLRTGTQSRQKFAGTQDIAEGGVWPMRTLFSAAPHCEASFRVFQLGSLPTSCVQGVAAMRNVYSRNAKQSIIEYVTAS
jgi:hypothetical protein